MPINSGYSFYEYAGDGVTTRFPVQFSIGELKRAYVTCRVDNEVDAFGTPLYRELVDVPGDPGMIEVLGAVPGVGVPIVFRRIVPKELLLHLYANGSILDYPSLDESHLQLMMALHEVLDGYGLTNVFTDINMNGYKLTNVYSDPDDPDSMATVAFLGTYRQDALDAAIAAADSALEALGYRDTALGHANTAAAQVVLCQDQVQLAVNQVLIAEDHADDAALSAIAADGFADDAEQSALDAVAAVSGLDARVGVLEIDVPALEISKLDKDQNINLGVAYTIIGNETHIDFGSDEEPIPAGVKRITVMFDGVSTNGTSALRVQVGDSNGVKNSGYLGSTSQLTSAVITINPTNGFDTTSVSTSTVNHGFLSIEKINSTTNTWVICGNIGHSNTSRNIVICGSVSLNDQLNLIRITTVNETDQFDNGLINISWEF